MVTKGGRTEYCFNSFVLGFSPKMWTLLTEFFLSVKRSFLNRKIWIWMNPAVYSQNKIQALLLCHLPDSTFQMSSFKRPQVWVDKQLCVSRCRCSPCCGFLHFMPETNEPAGHFVQTCKWFSVYFKAGQPVSELLKSSNIVIMTHWWEGSNEAELLAFLWCCLIMTLRE